jgi:hypothetical protein
MALKKKKKDTSMYDSEGSYIDFDEIETFRGDPDIKYSHPLLVMEQIRRCNKVSSEEKKKGWEERKEDRSGNIVSIKTHPDTRKEYAECVMAFYDLIFGYIEADVDAEKEIGELFGELDQLKETYVKMEEESWQQIPIHVRRPDSDWMDRWDHLPNTLNYDHIFGEKYLQLSVDVYRKIYRAMMRLLHRMGYFTAELRK